MMSLNIFMWHFHESEGSLRRSLLGMCYWLMLYNMVSNRNIRINSCNRWSEPQITTCRSERCGTYKVIGSGLVEKSLIRTDHSYTHPTSVFRQQKQQHMERERISCSMQQVPPPYDLCPRLIHVRSCKHRLLPCENPAATDHL